jgi:hypothetical protein
LLTLKARDLIIKHDRHAQGGGLLGRYCAKPLLSVDRPPQTTEGFRMLSKQQILDLQFIEARHKLLDLAAFLDRIDRHQGGDDFRTDALRKALPLLLAERPDRARAILEALSDTTTEPIPQAAFQGAFGAPSRITDH